MKAPPLGAGEVHVWRLGLERGEADAARLARLLSADERARAERLRKRRRGFEVGRGTLRLVLGAYLDADPAALPLLTGPGGKPRLAPGSGLEQLRFNVAHAGGRALLAVCRQREIGVDLERIAPGRAISTIAEQLFSPHEAAILRTLPARRRAAAFFVWWTRKEAVLKAIGTGLAVPLAEVDVADAPRGLRLAGPDGVPRLWSLQDLPVEDGYAAALAVEGVAPRLRLLAAA